MLKTLQEKYESMFSTPANEIQVGSFVPEDVESETRIGIVSATSQLKQGRHSIGGLVERVVSSCQSLIVLDVQWKVPRRALHPPVIGGFAC